MAFSFGLIDFIFGVEVPTLTNFVLICLCFFLTSTFTEFLNLLQTNLYKFNLKRLNKTTNKDDLSLEDTYDYDNDDENISAQSNLIKKIKFNLAENRGDYEYLHASKKLSTKAAEERFKKLMFFVEMMVYFLQTIISYSLMQAIMSENFWIFLSILLGYVFGYFLFYNDLSLNLILFAKLFEIYKRNLN